MRAVYARCSGGRNGYIGRYCNGAASAPVRPRSGHSPPMRQSTRSVEIFSGAPPLTGRTSDAMGPKADRPGGWGPAYLAQCRTVCAAKAGTQLVSSRINNLAWLTSDVLSDSGQNWPVSAGFRFRLGFGRAKGAVRSGEVEGARMPRERRPGGRGPMPWTGRIAV